MQDHAGSKIKRVVIEPASDRIKAAELVEVLRLSNIEVTQATAPFRSASAHTYMEKDSRAAARTFPAGSYVVDLDQPQRILIKSILEQDTPQDKAFVDDNMRRFNRNQLRGKGQAKEDYGFYDLTAWSLPLAFGVDAYWTEDSTAVTGVRVTDESLRADRTGSVSGRAAIAYIVPYETDSTAAMMIRLAQQGVRVSVTTRSLNAAGRNWPAGTFVIRVTRNAETVHDAVAKAASDLGVRVVATNTGFSDEGDTGVGGEAVVAVQAPKIALVGDEGVDGESYGSMWWTFDKYGIAFTPLSITAVKNGALKNYNVVILPDGSVGRYFSSFGTGGINTLKEFAAGGGTIVTTRGASVFAALKDVGLTTSKLVGSEDDEDKDKKDKEPAASPTPSPTPSARSGNVERDPNPTVELRSDKEDNIPPTLPPIASPSANNNRVPEALPGSIMRATVDRTTYLTYGVNANELPVILASGYFFRYSKEGSNALVFDANPKRPLTVSGFVWEGNTEKLLKGTAYVIDEPRGSGHVILFAEEPFYRGLFRATTRPFFNSILFNGVF
jgi:hypothetical protein